MKNIKLVILLNFFFIEIVFSQFVDPTWTEPQLAWTKTYGGNYDDRAYSVNKVSDGNFVIVGESYISQDIGYQLVMIKMDKEGKEIWTKYYGNNKNIWTHNVGYYIEETSDKGFIIAGQYQESRSDTDIWLLKTDLNGDTLWTRKYSENEHGTGIKVKQTDDLNYIILANIGSYAFLLIKTDQDGDTLWTTEFNYDRNHQDRAKSFELTEDGGCIVAGISQRGDYYRWHTWIIKTDYMGHIAWEYEKKGVCGTMVQKTQDDGFIFIDYIDTTGNSTDYYTLTKLNKGGNLDWIKTIYDSVNSTSQFFPFVNSSGDFIISITPHLGATLIKTDWQGSQVWNKTWPKLIPTSLQQVETLEYILVGQTYDWDNDSDIMIMKIEEKEISKKNILPIARYNLDQDGVNGIRFGSTLVGAIGVSSALGEGIRIFGEELALFLAQEGITMGAENLFTSLLKEGKEPKNIVIGFPYNGDNNKTITNEDVIFLYEYDNEELEIGYPYEITYESANTESESELVPPRVGKIISATDIPQNNAFQTIYEVYNNITTVPWFKEPFDFNTIGVVDGYGVVDERKYMILSQYKVSGIFGTMKEPHLYFVPVDVSSQSKYPSIGSVVKIEGRTKKRKHYIKRKYDVLQSSDVYWTVIPTSIEILNGQYVNSVEVSSSLLYIYHSENGEMIGVKWPENINAMPDFSVQKNDLTITNMNNFNIGNTETISAIIRNDGEAPGKCKVKFYHTKIENDHLLNFSANYLIGVASTDEIQPGNSATVSVGWDTKNFTLDPYNPLYIYAVITTSSPPEDNYSNNQAYVELFVTKDKSLVSFTAYCPVSLEVTSASGQKINLNENEITGSEYLIGDFNDDYYPDHRIYVPNDNQIQYSVKVIPNDDALPEENFTLTVQEGSYLDTLAENVEIQDASDEPYTYVTTDVAEKNTLPTEYKLFQNYPNPFNPSTEIQYSVPKKSFVTLKIYDILGNVVKILVNENEQPGNYKIKFSANNLSSGVYFYKITANNFTETKKMVLLR